MAVATLATFPGAQLTRVAATMLEASHSVAPVTLHTTTPLAPQQGPLALVNDLVGAGSLHSRGITGAGIDVALVDTGVSRVAGLAAPGKIIDGPDFSVDAGTTTAHTDGYGHGTHLAGIIAADDSAYRGVAPGARIVNLKAAAADGTAGVASAVAAIEWAVAHRHDHGVDIRVINLSLSADGPRPLAVDPLARAAEDAWRHGIVVVAAAGNDSAAETLADPAIDPFVIAVGAEDPAGTASLADDIVPSWVTSGTAVRHADVVAPGRSLVSLRVPGSYVDRNFPRGLVGERFFKGTGTSQAAAVVSGAAALVLSARPALTPDAVKALFMRTSRTLAGIDERRQGAGLIDAARAVDATVPNGATQHYPAARVGGVSRGLLHPAVTWSAAVALPGVSWTGDVPLPGVSWTGDVPLPGVSWTGDVPLPGVSWTGDVPLPGVSWTGDVPLPGVSWTGVSWTGVSWTGEVPLPGVSWTGVSWTGVSWTGVSWTGVSWTGVSWT
jgi:serine protease AprX